MIFKSQTSVFCVFSPTPVRVIVPVTTMGHSSALQIRPVWRGHFQGLVTPVFWRNLILKWHTAKTKLHILYFLHWKKKPLTIYRLFKKLFMICKFPNFLKLKFIVTSYLFIWGGGGGVSSSCTPR